MDGDNFTPPADPSANQGFQTRPVPNTAPQGASAMPGTQPSPETIVVKKEALDQILESIKTKDSQLADMQETIKMLLATADKSRMANYMAKQGKPVVHEYRLRTFPVNGEKKVIIKWKLKTDIMEKNPVTGFWAESQITTVTTEDGQMYDMPISQFERVEKMKATELGKRMEDVLGEVKVFYKVKAENGKEYEVEAPYIN